MRNRFRGFTSHRPTPRSRSFTAAGTGLLNIARQHVPVNRQIDHATASFSCYLHDNTRRGEIKPQLPPETKRWGAALRRPGAYSASLEEKDWVYSTLPAPSMKVTTTTTSSLETMDFNSAAVLR